MKTYMARQPIFDRSKQVYGYELLYRSSGYDNNYDGTDGDRATKAVVSDAVVTIGLDKLVGHKIAFINFSKSLLMSNFPFLVNPNSFVIELLEDTEGDEALLERLKLLKEKGYSLALDDYMGESNKDEIIEWMSIIKVDFKKTSPAMRKRLVKRYGGKKLLLAEKVETERDFRQAHKDGYDLFQGFFFSKPLVVSQEAMNIATGTYLRIWQELQKPVASFDAIAEIVRHDVNLSYKLLQRINTMEYYRGYRVRNVKQVLVHMGINEIKRWVQLILMRDMLNIGTSDELVRMALVRGIFSEKIAEEAGHGEHREVAYTIGLFSAIEDNIQKDIREMIEKGILPKEYQLVINRQQSVLTDIADLVKSYEAAEWEQVLKFIRKYRLDEEKTALYYLQAVEYANGLFGDELVNLDVKGELAYPGTI